MSFFTQASFVMDPNVYGVGKLYVPKPTDGSGDLTFTRASNGTRVNQDGLIEKVRTNLLTYSQDMVTDKAPSNTTVTNNFTTAPDGTATAAKLENTATSSFLRTNPLINRPTYSFYAKYESNQFVQLICSGSINDYVNFDIQNGIVGNAGSTTLNAKIESVGGGWYRCSAFFNSGASGDMRLYMVNSLTAGFVSANVTVGSVYYTWGWQAEYSDIVTDYIPTTTSAVSVGPLANIPRLNYGADGCPSLLLEPQTTALLQYSEQLDNGYWGKSGTSMLANQTTSPDGYVNADKSTISSGVAYHDSLIKTYSSTVGQTYTASIFAKKGVGIEAIYFYQGDGSRVAKFNLTTGEYIGHAPTNGYSAFISYGSEDFGNGWFRFYATYTATQSTANYTVGVSTDTTNTVVQINGNGTDHLYLWGANLTQTSYLQSYIPTLGAIVSRLADSAFRTGVSSLIGQTEGTLFVDFVYNGIKNQYANLINSEKNTTNSFYIHLGLDGLIRAGVFANSVQRELTASGFVVGQRYKLAFAYKTGELAIYSNGVQKAISTATFAFTSSLDDIFLNDTATYFGYQENVSFNQALLFKTRLTNAQLAELTTL